MFVVLMFGNCNEVKKHLIVSLMGGVRKIEAESPSCDPQNKCIDGRPTVTRAPGRGPGPERKNAKRETPGPGLRREALALRASGPGPGQLRTCRVHFGGKKGVLNNYVILRRRIISELERKK